MTLRFILKMNDDDSILFIYFKMNYIIIYMHKSFVSL